MDSTHSTGSNSEWSLRQVAVKLKVHFSVMHAPYSAAIERYWVA